MLALEAISKEHWSIFLTNIFLNVFTKITFFLK